MPLHNGIDLQEIARQAMLERGFRVDFPPAVLKETEAVRPPDFENYPFPDYSEYLWTSVDNDDSRDLDQAEVLLPGPNNTTRLMIAVANVDHFVPLGSATDAAAHQNTTSIYTGVEIFPMLPEVLSTDLSSLNEGEKRLAIVVTMDLDGTEIVQTSVTPAVIRNAAQLTYPAVAAFLEDDPDGLSDISAGVLARIRSNPDIQEQLLKQDAIAQAFRAKRFAEGALDFQTPEMRPVLLPDGTIEIDEQVSNRATQLIEEFMIASNKTVAAFLEDNNRPSIQRIVKTPKNWDRIVTLAAQSGWNLPRYPDGQALQAFLAARRADDPDTFPDLSLAVIKLLGRGEYVVKEPDATSYGHFGLGAMNYLHGTAANRRYPDLGNQRLVLSLFNSHPHPYSHEDLEALADWCTLKEGDAKKVERQVQKSIAAVALASRIGETFPGFITASSPKGVYVRVPTPPVEGKVVGGRTKGLEVGDHVTVRLVSTDPYRGYIDFEIKSR